MTTKEAKEVFKSHGVNVIFGRMSRGTPKLTISWRDWLKVRNIDEVLDGKILVAFKMTIS